MERVRRLFRGAAERLEVVFVAHMTRRPLVGGFRIWLGGDAFFRDGRELARPSRIGQGHMNNTIIEKPALKSIAVRKAGTIRPTALACYCYGCCCCVRAV